MTEKYSRSAKASIASVAVNPRSPFKKLAARCNSWFTRFVICRGDKVRYLRRQGVRIGEGCQIITPICNFSTEPWLIEIGNRVLVTTGVVFLTHDGSWVLLQKKTSIGSRFGDRFGKIVIHDECFIGMNSIIMPDVTIGPNSIVGAGSVVTKDVPPNTVVAGVPARPVCTLEEYAARHQEKSVPTKATNREELRRELTLRLWGEYR